LSLCLADFLTLVFAWCKERPIMRRLLRIRTALEPSRLGAEHCQRAYEVLLPMSRRRVADRVPKLIEEGGFEVEIETVRQPAKVENER
jgi:hypothetical protein